MIGIGFLEAFQYSTNLLGSIFRGSEQARIGRMQYNHIRAMHRLDSQIHGQQMIRKVKVDAVRAASQAAALLSTASIDISTGTPSMIIQKSFEEADKEVERILRTSIS